MRIGPPNALLWPKPMSSISTITTLGAPAGAFTSKRGGAFASRASSVVIGRRHGLVDRQHGAVEADGLGRRARGRPSSIDSRRRDPQR